ncbi:MAG: GAF domain-containing protein [Actinobacteria bacterium]|nr:GAF domain-containing protein [Actinomycetota bacterium]
MATTAPVSRRAAVDVLVGLLVEIEETGESREFFDRVCEALCRLTSLERAGLLLYDPARHLARAVGSHGIERTLIEQVEATLDETPMVQRALAEDRVVAVSENLEQHVPPRYARFAGINTIVCAPVSAGGHWFGVIFADRGGGATFELDEAEERAMLTLGRLAALASTVERSTRAQERASRLNERIALTREVHEHVIQRLFGLSLALGAERPLTAGERQRCAEELQAVLGQLRLTMGRPLAPQAQHTNITLRELLGQRAIAAGIEVEWDEGASVPSHLEALAQSVAVEALRNADRHSHATRTVVRVGGPRDTFELEVANDGVADRPRSAGLGLRILTLEALQHDGLLEFGPSGSDGWRVKLIVPIETGGQG